MKFYIASKFENFEQVRYLAGKLKAAGWTHTYDWTVNGSVKQATAEALKGAAQKAFDGVKEADVVIVLTPQGRGTHTELGMAAALNKRIYVCHTDDTYFYCDDNTSVFYWLPNVTQLIGSTDDIARKILCDCNEGKNIQP